MIASAGGAAELAKVCLGCSFGLGFVMAAVSEFRRAIAAEQGYHDLRYNNALAPPGRGMPQPDVPRLVFESFYSGTAD